MVDSRICVGLALILTLLAPGCHRPEIKARALSPWNRHEPEGVIPFYLPKPLLVISKNFYRVEEAQVGLTHSAPIPGGFDNQASYADLNARTNLAPGGIGQAGDTQRDPGRDDDTQSGTAEAGPGPVLHDQTSSGIPLAPTPGEVPDAGLAPTTCYSYQIVFVPDLSQKYGLKIRGGPGEMRAALNLVNGWQYTGLGPYYFKDSSTAQNILAHGITANLAATGVADVISSVADLRRAAAAGEQVGPGAIGRLEDSIRQAQRRSRATGEDMPTRSGWIKDYAVIHVFEPYLTCEGHMAWREITSGKTSFDRFYLGQDGLGPSDAEDTRRKQQPGEEPLPMPSGHGGGRVEGAVGPVQWSDTLLPQMLNTGPGN